MEFPDYLRTVSFSRRTSFHRVGDWVNEWVRCQFECSFRNVIKQNCFHLSQGTIHWCCSVSAKLTYHFPQMQCGFFIRWPNLDITRCLYDPLMLFCECKVDLPLSTNAVRFLYQMTISWYIQVSIPMCKYLWILCTGLLVVIISVKDNWQSNIGEIKWDFDITIYLSVDKNLPIDHGC